MAAFVADVENFTRELGETLILPWKIATQVVNDPTGEPLACAAKALGTPSPVYQRVLLFLKPEIGTSVHTVYRLARLYDTLNERSALIMLAAWRGSTMAVDACQVPFCALRRRAQPRAKCGDPDADGPAARKRRCAARPDRRRIPDASTADLKSLHHKRRIRSGTSDRSGSTKINMFASADDFPKFVKVGAAMEHELRKVGTDPPSIARQIEEVPSSPVFGLHDPGVRIEPDFLLQTLLHRRFRQRPFRDRHEQPLDGSGLRRRPSAGPARKAWHCRRAMPPSRTRRPPPPRHGGAPRRRRLRSGNGANRPRPICSISIA